jgi:hypothetical protein
MEQILIQIKDKSKAQALMNFLKTLDYIENITSANPPMVESSKNDKEADFFALAGLWANRDISQESLRKQAWPVRS